MGCKNDLVDIHNICLGNDFIAFYIVGISISVSLIILCLCVDDMQWNINTGIKYLGKNSLFIMVTHNYLGIREICEWISAKFICDRACFPIAAFVEIVAIEVVLSKVFGEKIIEKMKKETRANA